MASPDDDLSFNNIARAVLYLVDLAIAREHGEQADAEHDRLLHRIVTDLAARSREAELRFDWGRFERFREELSEVYRARAAGELDDKDYDHRLTVVETRNHLDRVAGWDSPQEIKAALWMEVGRASEDGTSTIKGLGGHQKAAWYTAAKFFGQSPSKMRDQVKTEATKEASLPFGHAPTAGQRLRWVLRMLLDDESDNHDWFAGEIEKLRHRRRRSPRWAVFWPLGGKLDHYVMKSWESYESWMYDERD